MKITKTRLKEIIKEELNEMDLPTWEGEPFGEYDLEDENKQGRAQRTHDLTKDAPINALLQALRVVSSPMLDATIRKLAFDVVKDLEEIDFNDFVEALEYAIDPQGEGF